VQRTLPYGHFGNVGTHFGIPSTAASPLVLEGGFSVRTHDYAPSYAVFPQYRMLDRVPYAMPNGWGALGLDPTIQPEPSSGLSLTGEQIEGLAAAGGTVFGLASEAWQRHQESMKALVKQRVSLQKKMAQTSDPWKRKQYAGELEYVNAQIASLKAKLSEEEDVGGGEVPWPLIIGVVALGGLMIFGLSRVSARRRREPRDARASDSE
jgi:hypothetical protein